jgi:hypothetical protein
MTTVPQKITFGEMRESGVRDVLIYRRDHHCSHHVETNADGGWPDHVRLSDIEPNFTPVHAAASAAQSRRPAFSAGPHGHRLGAALLQLHRALPSD